MACTDHTRRILRPVIDAICCIIAALPLIILRYDPSPFRRGFFCDDQSIMYPYKGSTVSSALLMGGGIAIPFVAILTLELIIYFMHTRHQSSAPTLPFLCCRLNHLLLSIYRYFGIFLFGTAVCLSFTYVLKYMTGRLRPHFFDVCKPNWGSINCTGYVETYQCTGTNAEKMLEARLSFPSGHASFSLYSATYVMLYLQGRVHWEKLVLVLKQLLQAGVMVLGIYVALTRVPDNKHHWSDVFAGSVLGFGIACVLVYHMTDLYRRPFFKSLEEQIPNRPRLDLESNDIVLENTIGQKDPEKA